MAGTEKETQDRGVRVCVWLLVLLLLQVVANTQCKLGVLVMSVRLLPFSQHKMSPWLDVYHRKSTWAASCCPRSGDL